MLNIAVTPKSYPAAASSAILPTRATRGIWSGFVRLAIPEITFPWTLWLSIRPSPVITRSAPLRIASNPTVSNTHSMPDFSSAPKKATQPPPIPPAAPAPGSSATDRFRLAWMAMSIFLSPSSSNVTMFSSAPFCGAKIYAAPVEP